MHRSRGGWRRSGLGGGSRPVPTPPDEQTGKDKKRKNNADADQCPKQGAMDDVPREEVSRAYPRQGNIKQQANENAFAVHNDSKNALKEVWCAALRLSKSG